MNTTLVGQRGSGFLYCCRTTLHDYAKAVNCELPDEGFVLPCKHCSSELVWTRGAWEVSNPNAWQMKQPTPQREVERFERGQQITEGRLSGVMAEMGEGEPFVPPTTVQCDYCPARAGFAETSRAGIAVYQCLHDHVTLKDYSRQLGLR